MRISFVIPAYNEEGYLGQCLDAIVGATKAYGLKKEDFEIIVVDNNSADGTCAIVDCRPDVTLIHEPRRGANRARETGFEASHGDLIACLDADTEISPDWLERVEKAFAEDKGLVCVSGPFIYYDLPAAVRALVKVFYYISYAVYLINSSIIRKTSVIQGGTEVVRRDALKKIGGHNVDLKFYGDDADLALRLSKVGKVKFSFRFSMRSSGRRLAKEGAFTMGLRYGINYFWTTIFGRPFTTSSKAIRFENTEGIAYRPENKTKEWTVGASVAAIFLLAMAAVAYLVKTW